MNENKIFEKIAKTNKTTPEKVGIKIRSFFEDSMKRNKSKNKLADENESA